ncbi:Retrovirus-related Pol poly from transposon [Biomphalaria pfeifferi]|uniref:Retrovirus-related Pol poly from transposon n=1 Tax=Biomphalaria pfeifferi TaxID=112525 RepID=A0AAD8B0Y7_BIOPF|nr:Retrovirus-related Pol poly from transposon [Biomphalaria pfeifferi]
MHIGKLNEPSSYLDKFNTPFGRDRFLRMPFGISSASEVLQKGAYQVFGDIPTKDEKEHDQIFENVLE